MESQRITRSKGQRQWEDGTQVPRVNVDDYDVDIVHEDDLCDHTVNSPRSSDIAYSCKDAIDVPCRSYKNDSMNMIGMNDQEKDDDIKKALESEMLAFEAQKLREKAEMLERHRMVLLMSSKAKETQAYGQQERGFKGVKADQAVRTECIRNTRFGDRDDRHWNESAKARTSEGNQKIENTSIDEPYGGNFMSRPRMFDRHDLPKLELPKFDGNASEYWNFVKQFEIHIEDRTSDDRERLLYLLNYCTGEARDAIKGFAILPAEEGYYKARALLKRLFGKPHIVSRNLIDGLLRMPKINKYDDKGLTRLLVKMSECYITLNQMSYLTDINSVSTLQRIVDKLPEEMIDRWIRKTHKIYELDKEPDFEKLIQFVDKEASIAQSRYAEVRMVSDSSKGSSSKNLYQTDNRTKDNARLYVPRWERGTSRMIHHMDKMTETKNEQDKCLVCMETHKTAQCARYIDLTIPERWNVVKSGGGCFSCLTKGHAVRSCVNRKTCGIDSCKNVHHPSLHEKKSEAKQERQVMNSVREIETHVSLGVVPVILSGPKGRIIVHALLDSGANTTIVSRDIIKKVGITGMPTKITINTVAGKTSMRANKCDVQVLALDESDKIDMKGVFAVNNIPVKMNTSSARSCIQKWSHLADIPVTVSDGRKVELIVGCDQPKAHWVQQMKVGGDCQPFGMKTPLGWVVLGPIQQEGMRPVNCIEAREVTEGDSIEMMVRKMYNNEFEDLGGNVKCLSREEREALSIVEEGTTKDKERYVVPLPWKSYPPELSDNRQYAMQRLLSLRKRFQSCSGLATRYNNIIEDHVKKGYVTKLSAPESGIGKSSWYLPHHPVFNPKKPDKMRIVFDCAARYKAKSLNDSLHQGPDTIASLVGILLRFRRLPVAIIGDIEEMFLQVKLRKEDQEWMKFLWWKDGRLDGEVETLKMLVHPFGARSSPFCANFALRRTIADHGARSSEQTLAIANRNLYVDDCITSVESVEVARKSIEELTSIMKKGGFRLRKWISNKKAALVHVPTEDLANNVQLLLNKELPVERALGVEWDAEADRLRFTFRDNESPDTRRGILSTIATVFDPLGLVSPLILTAKTLLQSLCKNKRGWDQPLEENELELWKEWKGQMQYLDRLTFPRCIRSNGSHENKLQLHIFADASEKGYGAVAYTRMKGEKEICCNILLAKARVAPLKVVTIPRLELNAAVLAVRLSRTIVTEFEEQFESVYFWVDSTIVLHYLHNTTARFVTFVANRVQEILESTVVSQWKHVPSEHNPADYASRGLTIHDSKLRIWMQGPDFLSKPEEEWPYGTPMLPVTEKLETKRTIMHMGIEPDMGLDRLLRHYSDWHKMSKAVVWLTRFKIYLCVMQNKSNAINVGRITVEELNLAERDIYKYVQRTVFPAEYKDITNSPRSVKISDSRVSRLRKLCPTEKQGLLVVSGRCNLANIPEESRNPIILPNDHPVTTAIVLYYHRMEGHAGISQTLAKIRERLWILHGGATVKRILRRCLKCRRLNATAAKQRMADLPEMRVKEGWYPFQYVGLDYFGPFQVRRGRMLEKRYGCLFTCLQCRAIHLELAQTLSTESFILALMRFVNKRGAPKEIYSDNGGNFIGAKRELREWLIRLEQREITDAMTERKITWSFNPPLASHRGGVWERMIRSVRKVLNSVAGRESLDEELLWTYLTQAERIVNDRPLTAVREGQNEPVPVRPSDLVQPRGREFLNINLPLNQLAEKRWRAVNDMAAEFWRRWKSEYLSTLQERQKWTTEHRELKKGDVVITEVESTPRTYWPLGIIEEVIADGDGKVRTVTVRTSCGISKRDIRKVYVLEGVG